MTSYIKKLETLRRIKDFYRWETIKAWDLNDIDFFSEIRQAWSKAEDEYSQYALDILPDIVTLINRLINKPNQADSKKKKGKWIEIQLPSV